jgi:hypothetical protein
MFFHKYDDVSTPRLLTDCDRKKPLKTVHGTKSAYAGRVRTMISVPRRRDSIRLPVTGRTVGYITGLVVCFACPINGQSLDDFNPLSESANGVRFYGLSVSGMYSKGTGTGLGLGLPFMGTLPTDAYTGTLRISGSFGWSRSVGKSAFSVTYSPSYARGVRGAAFDSTNHAASLSWSRPFGAKWTISTSANGVISDFNQLPFARTRLGNVAAIRSTFEDFVQSLMTGYSDNIALNRVVNMPPIAGSPETAFLYGGRLLSVSAGASASYALSSRSSFNVGMTGSRTQTFPRGNNVGNLENNAFLARTTSGGAVLGWAYSLTPRTTMDVSLSTTRTLSAWQSAYTNQTGISLGRTLTKKWFVQGGVGIGWITPLRQTFRPTTTPQATYTATTGYKVYSHTLVGSFSRAVSDVYGIGANATENGTAAWAWTIPGGSISLTSGLGYSRLIGRTFSSGRSFTTFVSAGKALNAHLTMNVGYSYGQFPTSIVSFGPQRSQSAAMASFSWSPSERR